jgi:oxaloacetate decarboxylase gamma subunit
MEMHIVGESIKFMILGMLIVFVFLYVLVEVMKLQAKLINKYFSPEAKTKKQDTTTPTTSNDDEEAARVAAIIAAVAEFRKNQS